MREQLCIWLVVSPLQTRELTYFICIYNSSTDDTLAQNTHLVNTCWVNGLSNVCNFCPNPVATIAMTSSKTTSIIYKKNITSQWWAYNCSMNFKHVYLLPSYNVITSFLNCNCTFYHKGEMLHSQVYLSDTIAFYCYLLSINLFV